MRTLTVTHSAIGYISPAEYERTKAVRQAA
jgi:hypothetical protein